MTTTTSRREKQVERIADAAQLVDIGINNGTDAAVLTVDTTTGEVLEEKKVSAPKMDAPKLPYGISLVEGKLCPECGAPVARTKQYGKVYEVCTKQFAVEPECWYANEIKPEIVPQSAEEKEAIRERIANMTAREDSQDFGDDFGGAQFKQGGKKK